MWDSQIGLGTVTHQNIGYLWPMGPFYWVLDAIGLPDWVAQRLWIGTVLFAAGMGVRYLLHTLDWGGLATRAAEPGRRAGLLVATLAYMLSPYLLNYSARISVILLPWAALPWLLGLTIKALRRGGWLYPALFALVIQTVGGINATALLLIGLAPLLWIIHAVWIERTVTVRRAWSTVWRIGALTLLTSLWWMAGLWAEGRYGLPVVRYTETYKTVASVSMAPEVLRGLGYWFFYGTDKLGPWIEPSVTFTQNPLVLVTSYALPIAALVAAALVRWRYRLFFIAMVVVGTLVAVGSHPWDEPSLPGALFKAFTRSDAGLAMRSTPRAVPLVALGLAVFLGSGVSAIGRRLPRYSIAVSALTMLVIVGNLPTLWTGDMVAANLDRPEEIPQYWTRRRRLPRRPEPRDAHPRGSGQRLRQLPLGQHRRSGDSRSHRSRLRRARALRVGQCAVGQPVERLRPTVPRSRHRSRGHRSHRPVDGRGRHLAARRPPVRALPHGAAAHHVGVAPEHAGSRHAGPVRRAHPERGRARAAPDRRDRTGRHRRRGQPSACRGVPGRESVAHLPHASGRPSRGWWPVTEKASSTRPASTS